MTSSPRRLRHAITAAALAALVIAAGCGSADADPDNAAPASPSEQQKAEPETTTQPDADEESPATEEPAAASDADASDDDEQTEPEAEIQDVEPIFVDARVVVIGSNAWPIVGNLLALGVVPVAIYSQLGNQEQPEYLTEAYGEELAEVDVSLVNLAEISPEEILLLDADRVVMPEFFRPIIEVDPVWESVIGAEGESAIFVAVETWRPSLTTLLDAAGVDAETALTSLQAEYDARLNDIAASLPYDPTTVEFTTFQWNEDGTYIHAYQTTPIVEIVADLGFQLHPNLTGPERLPNASIETVASMDADLVAIQVRNVAFESLFDDPLWSTTRAAMTGNMFERSQFGQQAGWLETLELLDQLAVELPVYVPS